MADQNRPKRRTNVKALEMLLGNRRRFLTRIELTGAAKRKTFSKSTIFLIVPLSKHRYTTRYCVQSHPNSPQIPVRKAADSSINPRSVVPGSRLYNCVRPTEDWTYIRSTPKVTSRFCNSFQEIRKQLLCVGLHPSVR